MNVTERRYIDLLPLKEEVEGNLTICKMLINSFITDIEQYIHIMTSDSKTNNFSSLYHVAHKIIPSVRIFNIVKLEPIIIQLERKLKNPDDIESINNDINVSVYIFNQVKVELQNELKSIENAAT